MMARSYRRGPTPTGVLRHWRCRCRPAVSPYLGQLFERPAPPKIRISHSGNAVGGGAFQCVWSSRSHNLTALGRPEESRGGPINYSDAGWVDLVPLDLRIGPAAPEGEDWGAGPINNSDTDEADFLPALETEHQR